MVAFRQVIGFIKVQIVMRFTEERQIDLLKMWAIECYQIGLRQYLVKKMVLRRDFPKLVGW